MADDENELQADGESDADDEEDEDVDGLTESFLRERSPRCGEGERERGDICDSVGAVDGVGRATRAFLRKTSVKF